MGIKQLYNDNLRKITNEYGDVSVMILVLTFAYDQICPLRPLVLKNDFTLVQMLRLIILDFFLPGNPSRVIGACIVIQESDNKSLI